MGHCYFIQEHLGKTVRCQPNRHNGVAKNAGNWSQETPYFPNLVLLFSQQYNSD